MTAMEMLIQAAMVAAIPAGFWALVGLLRVTRSAILEIAAIINAGETLLLSAASFSQTLSALWPRKPKRGSRPRRRNGRLPPD